MINTNGTMKKIGYILMGLCFVWSIFDYYGSKSNFEIIKFWVNIAILLIFGNTTKHIIGETIKGKQGVK